MVAAGQRDRGGIRCAGGRCDGAWEGRGCLRHWFLCHAMDGGGIDRSCADKGFGVFPQRQCLGEYDGGYGQQCYRCCNIIDAFGFVGFTQDFNTGLPDMLRGDYMVVAAIRSEQGAVT